MADNKLTIPEDFKETNLTVKNNLDMTAITPDFFVAYYWQFLPRYIASGRPTQDTMRDYCIHINAFIKWCFANQRHPLDIQDYQMRVYMEYLFSQNYSENTIAIKLAAVRAFFHTACKMDLIKANPCDDIKSEKKISWDEQFRFYSSDQIQKMCDYVKHINEDNEFIRYRDTLMIYLMGVEGFRNVEVHRLCDEDINWEYRSINVRGKGHGGVVYPCDATFTVLERYLAARPRPTKDGTLTPTIISDHRHNYGRISRNGIRDIMNRILRGCDLKHPGYSCHILRHSCGTNLYSETKDIRLVQEQLRHSDPKMTARYAHVHERMTNRHTEKLAPKID